MYCKCVGAGWALEVFSQACLQLSLKIIVSPRRLVMASRDKEGSHLSGVLGCLGLGSSSPGPIGIK